MKPVPAFAAAAAALALAAPAVAQPPQRLTLDYDGKLLLKVLELRVQQETGDRAFTASARLTTYGVLALFRKLDMRVEARGRLTDGGAQPGVLSHINVVSKKPRKVVVTWAPGDVNVSASPPFPTLGDPPASRAQKLEAADPLTQLMRLQMTPPNGDPCRGVAKFFDGKQRYDVVLTPDGPHAPDGREKALGFTAAVHCRMQYQEVAGFKKKPEAEKAEGLHRGVTAGFGRLGPNGPWLLSFMRADTMLGGATITLAHIGGRP